ncbi:unnamed protein product [Calypogeia fissa]
MDTSVPSKEHGGSLELHPVISTRRTGDLQLSPLVAFGDSFRISTKQPPQTTRYSLFEYIPDQRMATIFDFDPSIYMSDM